MRKFICYTVILASFSFISALNKAAAQLGPAGVGSSVSNKIWLDANRIVSTDGANIGTWTDQSGNSSAFSEVLSDRQPTYVSSSFSGLPTVRFDGVDDILASPSISALESANITYFIVYDRAGLTTDMLINGNYASDDKKWRTYMNNGQSAIVSAQYSPFINWVRYNDPAGASFFSSHITPTSISTYNQGDLEQIRYSTYTVPTGHNNVFLGNRRVEPTASYNYTGDISEVIIYNIALNSLERILVENYLGAKYGMAIATDLYPYEATHQFELIAIADDGTNVQSSAQGNGILEISNSLNLEEDEYLVVASTGESVSEFNFTDIPPSLLPSHQRLAKTWRVAEAGNTGTTTFTYHLDVDTDFALSNSYRLLVDNDGVFSDATVLTGTYDAVLRTVSFSADLSDGQYFTLSGIQEIIDIHSITDGPWNTTSTWDCGCIPTLNDNVFIDPATTVNIDGDAVTDFLRIESGGTLVMDADFILDINGDWEIDGATNFTDGTVLLSGTNPQTLTLLSPAVAGFNDLTIDNSSTGNVTLLNKSYTLNGILTPTLGNLVIDPSTEFIVLSTSANAGGRIGAINSPSTITGNFSVQRFIPPGNADWRNLSSPVIGSTFDDWDPDLAMSGDNFPDGCAFEAGACFASVTFTKNNTLFTVKNSTDPIENGTGFEVYVGDDLDGFSGTTLTSKGTINASDDFIRSYVTGWSTIGNPFACPISYKNLPKAGLGEYFYVYNPATGGYEWYDGITETSSTPEISADGIIATGQAVWVFTSALAFITYNQASKVPERDATFYSAATVNTSLKINLKENSSTYSSSIQLQEKAGAIDEFDEYLDIRHLYTNTEKAPSFSIKTGDIDVRKNFLSNNQSDKSFELNTLFINDGYYTLSASNIENFVNYDKILIFDGKTGELVDLKSNDYVFYANTDRANVTSRFTLILQGNEDKNDISEGFDSEINEASNVKIKQYNNIIDVDLSETENSISTITLTNVLGQNNIFTTSMNLVNGSNLITLPNNLKGLHIVTVQTGNTITTKKIIL